MPVEQEEAQPYVPPEPERPAPAVEAPEAKPESIALPEPAPPEVVPVEPIWREPQTVVPDEMPPLADEPELDTHPEEEADDEEADMMSEPPHASAEPVSEPTRQSGGLLQHLFATVPSENAEPAPPGLGEVMAGAQSTGAPALTRPHMPGLGVGLVHVEDSPRQERRLRKNRWFAVGIALFILFDILVIYACWDYVAIWLKPEPHKVYKAIPIQADAETPDVKPEAPAPVTASKEKEPAPSNEVTPPAVPPPTTPLPEAKPVMEVQAQTAPAPPVTKSEPPPAPEEKTVPSPIRVVSPTVASSVMSSADATLPVPPTPPLTAPTPPVLPITTVKLDVPLSEAPALPLPSDAAMTPPADKPPSAETSTLPVQKIIESKSPPEAASAVKAVKAFLAAPTWAERLNWVQKPETIRPLMEKYYRKHKDGAINVSHLDYLNHFSAKNGVPAYSMFEVRGPGFAHPVLMLVDQPPKKNAQVDWETFTEFYDDVLLKFLNNDAAQPTRFRVMMHRKHYFEKDVPELERREGFEIYQPNTDYTGAVFALKGSEVASQISSQLQWGNDLAVLLELVWRKQGSQHWVEIQAVPRYGWRG